MWGWLESKRDSSCPLCVKCAEEEWAKLCFQRAPSAVRCKGCSRCAPEDPSQAPTLAEIRYGCRQFSSAFCQLLFLEKETFLRERPGILPPLPPRKTQIQTQLYWLNWWTMVSRKHSVAMEKYTVKHKVALWLHAFFCIQSIYRC